MRPRRSTRAWRQAPTCCARTPSRRTPGAATRTGSRTATRKREAPGRDGVPVAQVLLTGATGVLGRHVLPELVRAGHDVTALSRARPRDAPGPTRWVQADLA